MPFARWGRRGLLIVGVALTTGCGIVDPCTIGFEAGMSGNWRLVAVNGQPIPTPGYPLPPPETDRLTSGMLHFKALKNSGSCNGEDMKSGGRVVAVYNLVTATGQATPTKPYGGTYEYNHSTGVLTLKAFGKSIEGNRVINEFTIQPDIPKFGTYALTFQRVN